MGSKRDGNAPPTSSGATRWCARCELALLALRSMAGAEVAQRVSAAQTAECWASKDDPTKRGLKAPAAMRGFSPALHGTLNHCANSLDALADNQHAYAVLLNALVDEEDEAQEQCRRRHRKWKYRLRN